MICRPCTEQDHKSCTDCPCQHVAGLDWADMYLVPRPSEESNDDSNCR